MTEITWDALIALGFKEISGYNHRRCVLQCEYQVYLHYTEASHCVRWSVSHEQPSLRSVDDEIMSAELPVYPKTLEDVYVLIRVLRESGWDGRYLGDERGGWND